MARLLIKNQRLHLSLSGWEQVGSLHADIRIAFNHIVKVEIVEKPWRVLHGIRAPGFGIPRFIMLGTMRTKGKKDFCAVYRNRNAVVVYLHDEKFERLIVTCDEPEKIARRLKEKIHSA